MVRECDLQGKVLWGCRGDKEHLEMLPPALGACPRGMGGDCEKWL